jgi:hypothetical protein
MDLLIYLQVAPIQEIRFVHPMGKWVKTNCTGSLHFDADNHSNGIVIDFGKESIEKATNICVLIEAIPDQKLGGLTTLVEKLVRSKQKRITFFFNGNHTALEKMVSFSKAQIHKDLTNVEIQKVITAS